MLIMYTNLLSATNYKLALIYEPYKFLVYGKAQQHMHEF